MNNLGEDQLGAVEKIIAKAAERGVELNPDDFTVHKGDVLLDGMDPDEWLAAFDDTVEET